MWGSVGDALRTCLVARNGRINRFHSARLSPCQASKERSNQPFPLSYALGMQGGGNMALSLCEHGDGTSSCGSLKEVAGGIGSPSAYSLIIFSPFDSLPTPTPPFCPFQLSIPACFFTDEQVSGIVFSGRRWSAATILLPPLLRVVPCLFATPSMDVSQFTPYSLDLRFVSMW